MSFGPPSPRSTPSFFQSGEIIFPVRLQDRVREQIVRKIVRAAGHLGATADTVYVSPNAWAINHRLPQSNLIRGIRATMLDIIQRDDDLRLAEPLLQQNPRTGRPCSMVFYGNRELGEPDKIEIARDEIVKRAEPFANVEGFTLY